MITLDHVTYAYPFQAVPAVMDISLAVSPGEAVLITGASGCGKSTIIRLINGLSPHYFKGLLEGRVIINGRDTTGMRIQDICRTVGTLFQDPEQQFFAMTVEDEIAFVHEWRESSTVAVQEAVQRAASDFGLKPLLKRPLHGLSEGQKQKVALASIMSLGPGALALDEPTANLDPEATRRLAELIRSLKRQGLAIVIVDHRLYWLEDTVDRVLVMDRGRIATEGNFSILSEASNREAYGLRKERVTDTRQQLQEYAGLNSHLEVRDLRFAYRNGPELYDGVTFTCAQGVTGFLGANGTGKTTLARLLTGLSPMRSGRLLIKGEKTTPAKLLKNAGIVLQNADHQLLMKTVRDELMLSTGNFKGAARDSLVAETLQYFRLDHLAERHPQSLSGGEKQRLVIACGIIRKPEILILDEPTSGLDGKNMQLISAAIRKAADEGTGVFLISHDLELIESTCDFALRFPLQNNGRKGEQYV
ncbi:MAG: ATP-binding cassette domain-containing protein [Pseudomonadota bacterium]